MRWPGLLFVLAFAACNDSPLTIGGATNDLGARTDGATASGAACSGLSETACNASPGCAADYCHFCGCEVAAFVRCRGADERPQPCPTPSCPVGICCAANADCALTNGVCVPPGQPIPFCGNQCATDADCAGRGPNPRCLPSSCDNVCCGNYCAPGCNRDGDCADGELCTNGLCAPPVCGASSPSCPSNFACSGSVCARTSCAVDSDCGAPNRCVLGRCYLGLGMCAASPR